MNTVQSKTLPVTGASLSYTIRGTGPLLLLIAGGEGGGDGYKPMADALSDDYTVVIYDRRGAPGSQLDDPNEVVSLEMHSEDAHQLLAGLTTEPVTVFGSSAGALVGLDLVMRYPGQVKLLVAHEPPAEGVLPEFDRFQAEVAEALQQGGVPAAMSKFMTHIGVNYSELEPGVVLPPRNPQEAAMRAQALMRYTFPAVHAYHLDVAALASTPVRVILAGGSAGSSTSGYRCTQTLASQLGTDFVEFPSHHTGYISYPRAFAARLKEVIHRFLPHS
jgi:pimeloyl-ACP methyl ester carboxylesterase